MKKNIFIVSLVGVTEAIIFLRWSSCWLFQNNFYFTFQNLTTQLLVSSNAEKGLPIIFIRLLHNKVSGFAWGICQTLLQYVDMRFVMTLLGVVGAVGVYLGFWYFLTRHHKNKFLWGWMVVLLILSFIEMFFVPHIDFSKRIIPFTFTLGGFSLFGIWEFVKGGNKKIRIVLVIILVILSLCSVVLFPHDLFIFCLKV